MSLFDPFNTAAPGQITPGLGAAFNTAAPGQITPGLASAVTTGLPECFYGSYTASGLTIKVAITTNEALTSVEVGQVFGGYTLQSGDDVILMGQTNPDQNGVYTVPASGPASPILLSGVTTPYKYTISSGTYAGKYAYFTGPLPWTNGTTPASFDIKPT